MIVITECFWMGLRHVFGDKPVPSILDFLMVHRQWDYPLSAIAEATGVSYRTLQAAVPLLVKRGMLKETRAVAKAKMYAINFDSPAVRKLHAFAVECDYEFGKREAKEGRVARAVLQPVRA
ncbi:MAG: hypothetical protein NTY90_04645 [Candidatus Micrarchaeota archaeon]|nr:hypothetical protein [Candidatus Micrarchaeota archaeon]